MVNDTERQEMMRKMSDTLAGIYFSPQTGEIFYQTFTKYLTDTNNYTNFVTCLGDTILGFYHTKDLPGLLQKEIGVSAEVAQKIVADLAELFAPVLEREANDVRKKEEDLRGLQQQFMSGTNPTPTVVDTPVATENPSATALTPEEEPISIHDVAPMRTMAGDMHRIHGYGAYRGVGETTETVVSSASQSDLLTERPRLAGVPKLGE